MLFIYRGRPRLTRYVQTHKFDLGAVVVGYLESDEFHEGTAFRGVITDYDSGRPRRPYLIEWDDASFSPCDYWPRSRIQLWTERGAINLGGRRIAL